MLIEWSSLGCYFYGYIFIGKSENIRRGREEIREIIKIKEKVILKK